MTTDNAAPAQDAGVQESGTQNAAPVGFQDSLPEEYRSDPSFLSYKSMGDLLKSHKNLESMLGKKDRVAVIPDEKSTPEEWQSYYAKIGRPEKPDGYGIQVEMPEGMPWDNEFQTKMLGVMHEQGLSKKQAESLMAAYVAEQGGKFSQFQEQASLARKSGEEYLKKEWGGAYNERIGMAKSAYEIYCTATPYTFKKNLVTVN
jgi:hypothetical protein